MTVRREITGRPAVPEAKMQPGVPVPLANGDVIPRTGGRAGYPPHSGPATLPQPVGPRTQPSPAHAARPAGRRRWRHPSRLLRAAPRPLRVVLRGAFALAVVGLLSLAIVFAMVQRGPISVAFMVGPITEAIRSELGAARVEVGGALLRLSEDGHGIEFRLADLRIKDKDGAVLAETPLAGITLSGAALLRGRLAPASVEFIRPRLHLSVTSGGGLALAVSRPPQAEREDARPSPSVSTSRVAVQPAASAAGPAKAEPLAPRPIDLGTVLQSTMAEARQGESVYLRELGLRDASLIIDHNGREVVWQVPGFAIDLQHFQKRSVIVGEGLIGSASNPWSLSFRALESAKSKRIRVEVEVAELVPRSIADQLNFLPALAALDMAVAGKATFDIALDSGLSAADVRLTLAPGRVQLPEALGGVSQLKGGSLHLQFSAAEQRIVLQPSELIWARGRGTWTGEAAARAGKAAWTFSLASADTNIGGVALNELSVAGSLAPESGETRIDRLALAAGDARAELSGGTVATPSGTTFQLNGAVHPIGIGAALAHWPKDVAPEMAQLLRAGIKKGRIASGTIRLGSATAPGSPPTGLPSGLAVALDLQDLQVGYGEAALPLAIENARLRLEGARLELVAPQARVLVPSGRHVLVRDVRLTVPQLDAADPIIEASLLSVSPLSPVLEMLDQEPFALTRNSGLDPAAIDGRTETALKVSLPLKLDVKPEDIKADGRIRVSDVRSKSLIGNGLEISGGTLLLGLTDKALEAKGDVLVAGVPAKVSWQRIFNAPPDRQPGLRLTATLDTADRDTLGLAVNHMVQGEVPIVVTRQLNASGQPVTHLEANLGAAEIVLETMAWRKPPGRPAVLHTDLVRTKDGRTELHNFKIVGDDIALDGTLTLDAKNQLRAFNIPALSVNVFTNLEMQGRVRDDGVLEVRTRGTAYDGRPFFRSLFSAGQITDRALPLPKNRPGLDLTAEIDTIVGFNDTNLKSLQFAMKRRADKIVSLKATGLLSDSSIPVTAEIRTVNGVRLLHGSTTDAGSAFRLIGIYPNMRGGSGTLEINLDGRGPADKMGSLRATQFVILGDAIVTEAIQTAEKRRGGTRQVPREQLDFEQLNVQFNVGQGQVVLSDSIINGPLLGARLHGKIDYNSQTVFLEGTYVPLYGLNSIPNQIPIIGDILSGGRSGDGLFGLSFQIQGPMGRPQVLVNPLSMLTPGLFRQIWETPQGSHTVEPRSEPKATAPPAQSSSSGPQTQDGAAPLRGGASSSGPQRIEPAAATRPAGRSSTTGSTGTSRRLEEGQ